MGLTRLLWAGVWRFPVRTMLLLLQIAVAFVLFGTLHGIEAALRIALTKQRADFLYVNPVVRGEVLPLGHLSKIAAVPNVQIVNPQNFLVGQYQGAKDRVFAVATDPAAYFAMNDYCVVPKDQLQALLRTRAGAIVGRTLALTHGWKIGDRIPLRTRVAQKDGSRAWVFEIVGIFDYPEEPDAATVVVANNEYFDAARAGAQAGTVARFTVKVTSADVASETIEAIDAIFANSSHETATYAEQESARTRFENLGNLALVANAVSVAALVALILSIGTVTMNSIRERTAELALLRALGFGERRIVALVFAESLVLFCCGALVGLGVASRLIPFAREFVGLVAMPFAVVIAGVACAAVLAFACAWLPIRYVLRLQPAVALAKA